MVASIKTHVIKIGNSQGIRIPKTLLEQLHWDGEVELEVQENQLVVRPVSLVRQGWDQQFQTMAEHQDDRLLDESTLSLTSWDDDWDW
ncbi:MAG: AbrB/MazE/SpoVT family DNA-binding domain-containing protein [Drouetiella hepatica Uher 2000/2452]|jgi:antitoxin MazE|uniref:AbrB/MazE/SpoVT family DNA-binding domain-containing protein n=1 Tax=Drouetiella hepatica Uher 2000/2452 TaxID=904376 RepID=A0A951UKB2_9CYAN|nr:AbrB/MazE/SpoVT family DNA-binding domain-containing protein [Drouetiella hepatica Uher 2000/2452]